MPTFWDSSIRFDLLMSETIGELKDVPPRNWSLEMALEIKGLKGKALKAGAMFDRVNKAYDKLIETGDAHAADVESLPAQFESMQDDISFAVQTLGNSVNGSGEAGEGPKPQPGSDKQTTAVASPRSPWWPASPAVEGATTTFPEVPSVREG